MSKENLLTEQYRWDLSVFYSGIDDPQIDKDIKMFVEMQRNFNLKYKGQLAQQLGAALADLSELEMFGNKFAYFSFRQNLNTNDPAVKATSAEIDRKLSASYSEYMQFFDVELAKLSDSDIERQYSDPVVAHHKPYITYHRIFKDHYLSEEVESALTKRSPFGPGSWSEFFDDAEDEVQVEYKNEKKTLTEAFDILTESKDAQERSDMLALINQALKGFFARYSAQTLYMVTGSKAVETKDRRYTHPMEARNKSNRIPDEVVEMLHKAVTEVAAPISQRYYRLKAKILNQKTLRWSDRNAPLPFHDDTKVPYPEAFNLVLQAYRSFSPTLADMIKELGEKSRIDVPALKGKHSGAYNSSLILPENKIESFILLNYLGSARDISTIAHELGHAVHGILAAQAQGPLMYQAPMAYAETASVFGEATMFNFLFAQEKEKNNKEQTIALLVNKIEDGLNTVVRQIVFSNFERRIHGMDATYTTWSEPRKNSVEDLNAIWLQTTKEFYGEEGDIFTYENAEHLWTFIPHFHSPFYVYSYAFGQLLSQSLYAQKEKFGNRFEPLYLDLLRAGGTKDAVELLKPFDLDPTTEQFWIDGINSGLGAMVSELEELLK